MVFRGVLIIAGLASMAASAMAQPAAQKIEKRNGVWVEGPGFDITYGADYEACARRCLENQKCLMLEYYRPETKCNHYDRLRPLQSGGASYIGIKK